MTYWEAVTNMTVSQKVDAILFGSPRLVMRAIEHFWKAGCKLFHKCNKPEWPSDLTVGKRVDA